MRAERREASLPAREAVNRPGSPRASGVHKQRLLLGLLALAILAWCVTLPLRRRMIRETERLNRQADAALALRTRQRQAADQLAQAKQAVEAAPNQPGPRLAYAALLQQAGDLAGAQAQLNAGLASTPKDAELHASLGGVYDAEHKEDLGIDEYRRALALEPNNVHALQNLAARYIALGWNRSATQLLDRAIKADPGVPQLHVLRAQAAFQGGGFDIAQRELLQARRLAPDDPAVLLPLIGLYHKAGRYDQALDLIASTLPTAADKVTLLEDRAQVYSEQHKSDLTLAAADEVLRLSPNDLLAHYLRGIALRDKGDKEGAAREWEQVYRVDPNFQQVSTLLGRLDVAQGHVQQGSQLLAAADRQNREAALRLRLVAGVSEAPDSPDAHRKMGQYYLQHGETPRAIVEFKRVLELQPNDRETRHSLATALQMSGRSTEKQG